MKHLLKPTGQILTTAVFTSTAVDASLPQTATPLPVEPPLPATEPQIQPPIVDASSVSDSGTTVAPPELESSRRPTAPTESMAILPEAFFATPSPTVDAALGPAESSRPTAPPADVSAPKGSAASEETVGNSHVLPALGTPTTHVFLPSTNRDTASVQPSQAAPPLIQPSSQSTPWQPPSIAPSNGSDEAVPEASVLETAVPEAAIAPPPQTADLGDDQGTASPTDDVTIETLLIESIPIKRRISVEGTLADINPTATLAPETLGAGQAVVTESEAENEVDIEGIAIENRTAENRTTEDRTAENGTAEDRTAETRTAENIDPQAAALQETQDWLEQKLAIIVEQARNREAFEHRQRLIEHARQSLDMGDINEARRIAENPTLTEEEREALSVAIAEARTMGWASGGANQPFIPLVPLNDALNRRIGIQSSPAANDAESQAAGLEIPSLPTTPLSLPRLVDSSATLIAASTDRLPSVPLAMSGLHRWPSRTNPALPAPSSLTAEELEACLHYGAPMLGDQTEEAIAAGPTSDPDIALETPSPIPSTPMAYIGTGQQPPSSVKASDKFPTGAGFLAGVGHQPPSILPDTGSVTLSSDPTPLKWTRDRLSQELGELEQATRAPRLEDCQSHLAHGSSNHGSRGNHDNIGGPTLASLTGYEWLSQFALPQPSSQPQPQPPTYMILPLPTAMPMTSNFGWRIHPIFGNRRFHYGLDYGAPQGTPIIASIPGKVETTGSLSGYGLTVIVENEALGLRTLYAHMSGIGVEKGQTVSQGQVLGWVGSTGHSTGPHLHFEVHKRTAEGWVAVDPLQAAADLLQASAPE